MKRLFDMLISSTGLILSSPLWLLFSLAIWLAGIEVISLKGATASEKIFGDIGLYPSGDIDILVKVEDIDRVWEFLEADG